MIGYIGIMDPSTLRTAQVASYCGVSTSTVLRWIKGGSLKSYQLPGRGDNRIRMDDFVHFLQAYGMPVPAQEFAGAPAEKEPSIAAQPAPATAAAGTREKCNPTGGET